MVAEEEIPPMPQTPFGGLLRLGANSGVGARRVREGVLSHLSASNSPILGWWLLRGDAIVDSRRPTRSCSGLCKLEDLGLCVVPRVPSPPFPPIVALGPVRVRILNVSVCVCVHMRDLGVLFVRLVGFYWVPPSSLMGTCHHVQGPRQHPGCQLSAGAGAASQVEWASTAPSPAESWGTLG